jgi:hypothetical protein
VVEARVYAEDPAFGGRPSTGLVTAVRWPAGPGLRVDAWIEAGLEVSPSYDPMLAKVIAHAADRDAALEALGTALRDASVDGVTTNLGLLRAVLSRPDVRDVSHSTSTLEGASDPEPRIEVLEPGALTTVQDWPGRLGYWQVGVPPSGPMDEVSLREANLAVGNPEGAAALECTANGPRLRFCAGSVICLAGAVSAATLDGAPVPFWEPVTVPAGGVLDIGPIPGPGLRTYLAVRGGLDVPLYLGSASTFTLGRFGGHSGRALRAGDVLCFPGGRPPVDPRLRGDAPLKPPLPGEPAQNAGPRDFPSPGLGATPPSALPSAGLGATPPSALPSAGLGTSPPSALPSPGPRLVPRPIAHIAPDPLEAAFSPQEFAMRLRRRRTGIKRALLDQSLISGIGNIYADEALWRARLHWARPTETMRPSEVARLLTAVHEVLTEALKAGGTSFDSLYVNVNGQSGYFDRSLEAYGRAGQPCSRCATLIRRDSFMNRSSFSCPRCQPRPRSAHW